MFEKNRCGTENYFLEPMIIYIKHIVYSNIELSHLVVYLKCIMYKGTTNNCFNVLTNPYKSFLSFDINIHYPSKYEEKIIIIS